MNNTMYLEGTSRRKRNMKVYGEKMGNGVKNINTTLIRQFI